MKRFLILLLIIPMLFSFIACDHDSDSSSSSSSSSSTTTSTVTDNLKEVLFLTSYASYQFADNYIESNISSYSTTATVSLTNSGSEYDGSITLTNFSTPWTALTNTVSGTIAVDSEYTNEEISSFVISSDSLTVVVAETSYTCKFTATMTISDDGDSFAFSNITIGGTSYSNFTLDMNSTAVTGTPTYSDRMFIEALSDTISSIATTFNNDGDTTPKTGVTIDGDQNGSFTITFDSNYVDKIVGTASVVCSGGNITVTTTNGYTFDSTVYKFTYASSSETAVITGIGDTVYSDYTISLFGSVL